MRGGAVTVGAQGCKFVLRMGSTVVLARLLTPDDFGLVAMVAAVTGFVLMFSDMGLSASTVQRREISHEQVSTLFWLNVAISVVIAVVIAAVAVPIAWFYDEPRLIAITLLVALCVPLIGVAIQHQALLRRQMRFASLAALDVAGLAIGVGTAIVLAALGAGYWALVFMPITSALAASAGAWVVCGWRPGMPVYGCGIRPMLAFGGYLTGFNFVNYFNRNLDNVLIGRVWGAVPLGLYTRAYGLLMLPLHQINAPVSAVAGPALSRLQDDGNRFRKYYTKGLSLVAFVTFPLIVFLMISAGDIVMVILGPQWLDATVIFRFLALAALVQPICNTTGWLYIALGRTDRMFKWGLFASLWIVASFFVGLPYGPRGVALCYGVATLLLTIPCLVYATRGTPIAMGDIARAVWHPMLASVVAGVVGVSAIQVVGDGLSAPVRLLGALVLHATIYLMILFFALKRRDYYLSVWQHLKRS